MTGLAKLRSFVRDVPDFPKPGITFKDITPLLGDAEAFAATVEQLAAACAEHQPTVIVGLESRGFIFGAAVAMKLGCAFVPVRKPGKLPARTERVTYDLEYGHGELEIHADAFPKGARAVIVDDLLATGGTAAAATTLVERLGGTVVGYGFVIELLALDGRTKLRAGTPIDSLLRF
ncbi:adenine phosphoribosyltransferase [Candidatus Uhrbacteria bacterium]|nr:adenine phosphoribosyltransferase [Candidatus Uhrbacteria bacterium]